MIYELREYVAAPGRADVLHKRFADQTLALFATHGITVAGFWTDVNDDGRVVYLVRFADEEARARAWEGFGNDPHWQRVKAESEADGPVVAEMHSTVLTPTAYLPYDTTMERP
jgi:hypothetical protein